MKVAGIIIGFWICILSANIGAQGLAFEAAMKEASVAHDTASSAQSELIAIEQCKKISRKYPDAWQPLFWAAYYATQLTQYPSQEKGDERKKNVLSYLKMAQENLDNAHKLIPPNAKRIQSSFHGLQSLIYSFKIRSSPENDTEKYMALYKEAITSAITTSPDNPVVLILLATDLVKEGNTRKDTRKLLAGKVLLHNASRTLDVFEKSQIHHSLTPHFNSEWVKYWTGYVDKLLAGKGS